MTRADRTTPPERRGAHRTSQRRGRATTSALDLPGGVRPNLPVAGCRRHRASRIVAAMSLAVAERPGIRSSRPVRPTALVALTELTIAVGVFAVYRAGRLVTNDSVEVAMANAQRLVHVQRPFVGDIERWVQEHTLQVPGAIEVLNHFYVFVHFPVTAAFLVWVFVRHRDAYRRIRDWFVGVTMAAMVVHVAFPLAPPRMLDGFVDTLRAFGPQIYSEDPSRSVANQFAAMPSLHFGWALMVAVGIILVSSGVRRWWWLCHPAMTLVAIVATGNHYLADALVAAILACAVWRVMLRVSPARYSRITCEEDVRARSST